MKSASVSVIMPFCNQADFTREIVCGHVAMLAEAGIAHELILVPNGSVDDTNAVCRALAAELPHVHCLEIDQRGWGCAVRSGIAAATGALICYTNSARTQPDDLRRIITHAMQNPGLVVKATRFNRHSRIRRLGSLIYNVLCGALLRLPTRDVNGTPKVFPHSASTLRNLQREDDLIDLEFMWRCARGALPVAEIPVYGDARRGGDSTTDCMTAWRLYSGAVRFWRQMQIESRSR
jgi:glycosyltransferase involved in cell wall biosynthesis